MTRALKCIGALLLAFLAGLLAATRRRKLTRTGLPTARQLKDERAAEGAAIAAADAAADAADEAAVQAAYDAPLPTPLPEDDPPMGGWVDVPMFFDHPANLGALRSEGHTIRCLERMSLFRIPCDCGAVFLRPEDDA